MVRRMKLRLLASFFALALGLVALRGAETDMKASKPEVRKQIVATIDAQLAAFRAHDVTKAYTYADAALRAQKPLPVFTAIVRTNYPEIWTNKRAEYGIVRDDGTVANVLVHVFGADGDTSYDYELAKQDGTWRIHGVLRHEPVKDEKV